MKNQIHPYQKIENPFKRKLIYQAHAIKTLQPWRLYIEKSLEEELETSN
jgi:hypothetical protein